MRPKLQNPSCKFFTSTAGTAQQLVEASGMDKKPKYLVRDRDAMYGGQFRRKAQACGIQELLNAYQSAWRNPYAVAGQEKIAILGGVR
jgi:hypothetical protein